MKDRSFFRILYGYLLTQISALCITAILIGVTVAEDRTQRMMSGEAVTVSVGKKTKSADEILTRMLIKDKIKSTLCSLPAPIGNTASAIICLEKILE